jgi:protein O-mannosyl-transferase
VKIDLQSTEPAARRREVLTAVLIGLVLAAAIEAVYAPVVGFGFVNWDDPWYVTGNSHVAGGLSWASATWAFTSGGDFYWHPLTWLSHMLDVSLFGLHAGGHHATSVLLHIANTLLLFALLLRSAGFRVWRSAFVAALFALHPLHVESVAWIAERKDVLSGLFWMLSLLVYLRYAGRPGWRRYAVLVAAFACGLMSKPMVVTLPVVLLLLDVWPLRRWPLPLSGKSASKIETPTRASLLVEKLPLLALSALAAVATFVIQGEAGALGGLESLPIGTRVSTALVGYWGYLAKAIWPAGLAAFYPYPAQDPNGLLAAAAALGIAGAIAGSLKIVRTHPYVLVGLLWYLVTLLPVTGLFQSGDQLMADRFTYLPLVGIFVIAAWGIPDLVGRWIPSRALIAAGVAAAVACAVTASAQTQYWRNSEILWTHALAVTTGNHRAEAGLGEWLASEGRVDEAVPHFEEAVRLAPAGADYRHGLAMVLLRQGKVDEAARQLEEAIRLNPRQASARVSLGAILARQGRTREAIAHDTEALRVDPGLVQGHTNLGLALSQEGRLEEALRACTDAVRLDPAAADARQCQGVALARLGRPAEAVGAFEEAVRLNPAAEAGYINLGLALAKTNRTSEAARAFENALRINPANDAVRNALQDLKR